MRNLKTLCIIVLLAVLVFAGCSNPAAEDEAVSYDASQKGTVTLNLGGGTPSRIAWPPLEYGGLAGAPSRSDLEFEVRFSGALINGTPVTGSPGQYTFTVPFGTHDIEIRAFVTPGTPTNPSIYRSHYTTGRIPGINVPGQGSTPVTVTMLQAGATAANPFLIFNERELRKVGRGAANPLGFEHWTLDRHYRLMANITLTGPDWDPIPGNFTGTFNGGGFNINGLTINNTTLNESGMFAENSGTIENLNLPGVNITQNMIGNHGGVSGFNNAGTVRNITVSGNISRFFGTGTFGGVIGLNGGIVENSSFTGTISCTNVIGDAVGGIVGINFGLVQNSFSSGDVSGGFQVGGVIGFCMGTVQNSFSLSNVYGTIEVGGVVGWTSGIVQNNVSLNQKITRTSGVNGFFGRVASITPPMVSNNHAYAGMVFFDGVIPQPDFPIPVVSDPNGRDGADVSPGTGAGQFNNQDFWETTLGWDFTNVWQMQGSPPLPALRPPPP